jgi:mycoredoxin
MRPGGIRRWRFAALNVVTGIVASAVLHFVSDVDPVPVLLFLAWMLGNAWWMSPLHRGPHVSHEEALARADAGDVVVYWRPGCRYCTRLRRALRAPPDAPVGDLWWVNVLVDGDAAAYVADRNDGDVVTPTVITGAGEHLDGDAQAVLRHLSRVGGVAA